MPAPKTEFQPWSLQSQETVRDVLAGDFVSGPGMRQPIENGVRIHAGLCSICTERNAKNSGHASSVSSLKLFVDGSPRDKGVFDPALLFSKLTP
jgi:hypothetical protein